MNNSLQENSQKTPSRNHALLVKSNYYECGFCKKGFNNPQALGGHMNMHRKDRAKSTCQTDLTAQLAPGTESHDVENNAYNRQGDYSYHMREDNGGSSSNGVMEIPKELNLFRNEVREFEDGGDGGKEIDLELRLGYQPWI